MSQENSTERAKDRVLDAAILHAPFDGWSEASLKAAIADSGVAEALARALAASSSNLPACQVATLHGDLHTANVIVDDRGPVLIDLDSLVAGDPAFDLAMLGSRIVLSALNRGEPAAPSLRMAASLPSWYTAAGGRPIDDYVYAWYVAALLLGRQIKTCLRHSAPITGRIAPQLLALAHALLERGSVTSAHDVFS